jgi:signal transduction histidine kinase
MKRKSIEDQRKSRPLIFIAEDVPGNLQVLCNILEKEEYRIAAAGNGRQALEMVPEVRPDLVLLDIMMPEMDGFEVCEQLKKNPRTRDIPIIFLTAKAETADIVRGLEIGAVDYVTKPFNRAELLSRIKTHLELQFARETLKALIAAREKFFFIIAHDLASPLQFLLLSSDFLYSEYDTLSEEMRKDYIRRFYNNASQLTSLLENLLSWYQSQKNTIQYQPEKIDIGVLVKESIELLKENAPKKNIAVSSQIQENTAAFADKYMIRTVIRNLLSNAVKFTHPGGKVNVFADSSKTSGDNSLEITVADNGVGIREEDIAGLFRIDVHKTTPGTADEKGTGLGLILCKEFVEKNNGSIQVTSTPGKGSCFTITLPIKNLGS